MANEHLEQLKIDKNPAGRRQRRQWRRPLLVVAALVLALAAVQTWRNRPVVIETASVSQVFPTQTLTVLNASGYVVAQRKAAVAAKITGRLDWVGVEEGSRVRAGQILARLDSREAVAALEQARASLAASAAGKLEALAEQADATRQERRLLQLFGEGFLSRAEIDQASARRERADAAVAAAAAAIAAATAAQHGAEIALDNTIIRAPFDAVVLTKNADIGDIVTPLGAAANAKAAVVSIADPDSLQIEADVSEANLGRIRIGQPCEVLLDAITDRRYSGTLQTIVPTADRSKATILVKVRLLESDPRILPEMSARVAFLERPVAAAENRAKTVLPPAAVVRANGRTLVYRLDGDRVRAVTVTLGGAVGDQVEVTSGVAAGDKIALSPLARLRDGRRIAMTEP